jgi:pantothenate kinase
MESTYQNLAEEILRFYQQRQNESSSHSGNVPTIPRNKNNGVLKKNNMANEDVRILIALAGPPGSGKSTIAEQVVQALASIPSAPKTVAVSIDGFHLPLATLHAMPNAAEAIARRGAPWTFDAEAAVALVKDLGSSFNVRDIPVPTFDHAIKDPVACGQVVKADVQVCILEGNYLLSDEGSWSEIANLVDQRWLVKVDPLLARTRVATRHLAAGIEPSMDLALARTDYNDIPNGEYVAKHSQGRYDLLIESIEESRSD